jgi:hypothetical protein
MHPDWLWGPPMQWVPGALSLGVKAVQCAAGHLSPSTAKFKNQWSYASMLHKLFWIVLAQVYLTFILVMFDIGP